MSFDQVRNLRHGLYLDVSDVDGRTQLGKAVKSLITELREHVGQNSVVTEMLIHRIAYKTVRLSLYEVTKLSSQDDKEAVHYLPMANSLRLDLAALQSFMSRNEEDKPSLNRYLKEKYGADV